MKDFQVPKNTRIAIYSRFSSDMQRPASIEDQQRNCREAAVQKGWTVLEDFLMADSGVSGRTLDGRDQFNLLIELATGGQAPFDGIVVDDTSRFGRNLTEVLTAIERLSHANVFVYFATNGLDSRDLHARQLLVTLAQHDEQHSIQLGEKVHRGMRGRVLNGYIATGRPYGYKSAYIFDEDRKGQAGMPAVKAVDLDIVESEAAVIRRIFQLCADGWGFTKIARILQAEGIPSPNAERLGKSSHWHSQTVKRMIANEKYKGLHVWNKTKLQINPNLHRREQVPRPKSQWETVSNEKWRIVSDELWQEAQFAHQTRSTKYGRAQTGGHGRWKKAEGYIFSGLLTCAECGGFLRIFSTRETSNRYVCYRALNFGGCSQRHSIHRGALEPRLLSALKSANEAHILDALCLKIEEAEYCEQARRRNAPSLESLERLEKELCTRLNDLYYKTPASSQMLVFKQWAGALEREYATTAKAIVAARQQLRPLITRSEARELARQLVEKWKGSLVGEPTQVRAKLSVHLQPIQVSWKLEGSEKLMILFTAINFHLLHSNETVSLPLRVVISRDFKRDREKRFTDQVLIDLCSGQIPLTARQIVDSLGLSRSTLARWCKAGLPHHHVPPYNSRGGNVRIYPEDLKRWLAQVSTTPSEVSVCLDEQYPTPLALVVNTRRKPLSHHQGQRAA
jgi:DNA invertase Pin-like site-specific DNA recombinase